MITWMAIRAREEQGFGLIELLIALIVLSVGILAMFGAFNAGALTLRRASNMSTAAALADKQMEGFRALNFASIGLLAPIPTTGGYMNDTESAKTQLTVATCNGSTGQCTPSQTITGPNGHSFEIDTYVVADPDNASLKRVTITVRDGLNVNGLPLARESSSFGLGL
jgi:prepilin-type N-terminal cleavage/methylation domain-containing protein